MDWSGAPTPTLSAVSAEQKACRCYIAKLGMEERYDSGRRKVSLYRFRAFFFTRAVRVHGKNYAHRMTGHGGYFIQYDRLTDEERIEMYSTLEPSLLIYDQTRNEEKIERLKEANTKLEEQAERISRQDRRIRELERSLLYGSTTKRGRTMQDGT